jgi:hypothetical protein
MASNQIDKSGLRRMVKVGIATGSIVAGKTHYIVISAYVTIIRIYIGIVGIDKFCYDIYGDIVNTASRMQTLDSEPTDTVLCTNETFDLFSESTQALWFDFGTHNVKGKGRMSIYALRITAVTSVPEPATTAQPSLETTNIVRNLLESNVFANPYIKSRIDAESNDNQSTSDQSRLSFIVPMDFPRATSRKVSIAEWRRKSVFPELNKGDVRQAPPAIYEQLSNSDRPRMSILSEYTSRDSAYVKKRIAPIIVTEATVKMDSPQSIATKPEPPAHQDQDFNSYNSLKKAARAKKLALSQDSLIPGVLGPVESFIRQFKDSLIVEAHIRE